MKKRAAAQDEWIAGFAVALAEVHRLGNSSSGICEVAKNAGLTRQTAKAARVSDFDLRELKKAGVPWRAAK